MTELYDFLAKARLIRPDLHYVIQAGYHERKPDLFAFASLRRGLALKATLEQRTGTVPKLYSLCNDIGPRCGSRCDMPETTHDECRWQAPILREKTALNRGLRRLRKLLKAEPSLFTAQKQGSDTVYSFMDGNRTLVNLAIAKGDQLIGLCPLVLASFYEMLLGEEGPGAVLIDYCHYVDVRKIATAVEVLNRVFLASAQTSPVIIAAALDIEGNQLNPILI